MRQILLDTNAFRKYSEGDEAIEKLLETTRRVWLSPIVLGELLAGFKIGNKEASNLKWINKFLEQDGVEIPVISGKTSKVYAQVRYVLRKKGKPIPHNDMWIAAQAMETGAVLVTYDEKHFKEVPGLRLWEG